MNTTHDPGLDPGKVEVATEDIIGPVNKIEIYTMNKMIVLHRFTAFLFLIMYNCGCVRGYLCSEVPCLQPTLSKVWERRFLCMQMGKKTRIKQT